MNRKPRGRPRRYQEYERLLASLPDSMKRPKYVSGIGLYRGPNGHTVWLKILLRRPNTFKGRYRPEGSSIEVKMGKKSSWSWADLERKLAELQGRADRGDPLEEEPVPSFSEHGQTWLKRAERLRSHSLLKTHFNTQLNPLFGDKALHLITLADVNNWLHRRLGQVRPATVKRELSTLKTILNDAVKNGFIDANPADNADSIRGVVGRQRFLSKEEIELLLAVAENIDQEIRDLIEWAIHSGMRKSEILAMTWGDVQFVADRLVVLVPKSKTDEARQIAGNRSMVNILERQKERLPKSHRNAQFWSLSKMTFRRRWEAARAAAKLDDVVFHDLRRTHVTHAAASGTDLVTLSRRLGHSSLQMLEKHYAALIPRNAVEAADRFESFLGSRSTGQSSPPLKRVRRSG